jgi:hypothetical protein
MFFGAPLLIVVPLVHVPVLRWLARRIGPPTRQFVVAIAGIVLSLPLVLWPLLTVGGNLGNVVSPEAQYFAVMYAVFGLLFGTGIVRLRSSPANERREDLRPRS